MNPSKPDLDDIPENQILHLKDLFDIEKNKNFDFVTVKDSDGNTMTIKKETLMLQLSAQQEAQRSLRREESPIKSP